MNNNAIAVLLNNKNKIIKCFILLILIVTMVTSLLLNINQKFTLIDNELKISNLIDQKNQFYSDVLKVNNEKKQVEEKLKEAEINLSLASKEIERLETQVVLLNDDLMMLNHLKNITTYIYNGNWHYKYTEDDVILLATVIYGENYVSGRWEMMITGSVVLNRVMSEDFPDTIKEVVYEIIYDGDKMYEQYAQRTKNLLGTDLPEECYRLARLLLEYGPVVPPFVLYQAHFNQGKIYWDWKGEQFCYK